MMKRFLNSQRRMLIAIIGVILTITFLAIPVIAEETSPAEMIRKAEMVSLKAAEMAAKARETGDIKLAGEALKLTNEALAMASNAAQIAQKTSDTKLAQQALNTANELRGTFNLLRVIAQNIMQTSTNQGSVSAARQLLAKVKETQSIYQATIGIALASGAVPGPPEAYEPPQGPSFRIPLEKEPPIQDTGPASQV